MKHVFNTRLPVKKCYFDDARNSFIMYNILYIYTDYIMYQRQCFIISVVYTIYLYAHYTIYYLGLRLLLHSARNCRFLATTVIIMCARTWWKNNKCKQLIPREFLAAVDLRKLCFPSTYINIILIYSGGGGGSFCFRGR